MGLLGSQIIHEPLNILYLAAVARNVGAQVKILDYGLNKFNGERFKKYLKNYSPDILGFSCMTQDIHAAADLAAIAKDSIQKPLIIAGGVHPSVLPKRTLEEFPFFDAVVFGEGEKTLEKIIETFPAKKTLAGILGVAWRGHDGEIHKEKPRPMMENLSSLPLPARDLVETDKYLRLTSTPGLAGRIARVGTIFTSRGCPYQCIFCSGWQTCGKVPRKVPVDMVAREISELAVKYGVKHITIKDDTFTIDPDYTIAVGRLLSDSKITWDCKTRINVIDRPLLIEMKNLGCVRVHMGVESGSDRILKLIRKNITADQVREAFAIAKEMKIERTAYFIIGAHPAETYEEHLMSRALCKEIKADYAVFSVVVPYPGTEVNKIMKEAGQIFSEDWRRYNPFVQIPAWKTDHFSPEKLMELQKKAMTSIYFSSNFIFSKLKTLRRPSAWGYWGKSALDFIKWRSRK